MILRLRRAKEYSIFILSSKIQVTTRCSSFFKASLSNKDKLEMRRIEIEEGEEDVVGLIALPSRHY